MTTEAPLFRLVKVSEGASVVTASLWERAFDGGWHYNGNLTMSREGFAILRAIIELGARRGDVVVEHINGEWIATKTGYTRKEWS